MQPRAKYRTDYRTPDFTITDISLDFQLAPHQTNVVAISQVKRLANNASHLHLDGQGFTLLSVRLNGEKVQNYEQTHTELILPLPLSLNEFELEIITQLDPAENTSLQGLYLSGNAFCTQCEAEGFRQITYFLDRPDVLARYTTKITADKNRYPFLLSNGNCVEKGEQGNEHWAVWQDPFPKPSYLFALVAGDFDVLRDTFTTQSGRVVHLELFVDKGNLNRADFAMASLKKAMKWEEERFGLEYDLDIYMIVAVDFFNMGAMENKGLNVFNAKYVLANPQTATDEDYLGVESVIGHEYFHNWTGNRVTCRDWFQLSLKEGLTVFRDQEFSSDTGSRAINRINNVKVLRTHQFAEDASPMSHPIRPEKVIEMNNFYTMTVYEKGAEVIRMLHTLLGEKVFQAGMKRYISQNDGRAVTCDDFVQAMSEASGQDLRQFKRWYHQSGTPILTVSDEYDETSKVYRLTVHQHTPATADQKEKQPLHLPLSMALYGQNGQKLAENVLSIRNEQETFTFSPMPERPIPALLCDFSAPVKLRYAYDTPSLIHLMTFADNDFIRWDCTQMLFNDVLQRNILNYQTGKPLTFPIAFLQALQVCLENSQGKEAITALMLTLPSPLELAENLAQIDPSAITAIHHFMQRTLAEHLQQTLLHTYQSLLEKPYDFNQTAIAKRALRNMCLSYLAFTEQGEDLVTHHYFEADNMTDSLGALKSAVQANLACLETLLLDFEEKWGKDPLVMDKWFTLQANRIDEASLTRVKDLLHHPAFDLANPNRVRSLIGAFCLQNLAHFHQESGAGYAFLTEILIELNASNPQVASRLIEPLIRFERFDLHRKNLMQMQLQRLQKVENLSKDLFEKIDKALNSPL